MAHPIIVGVNFLTNDMETQGLALGEIGARRLVCAHSRCSPLIGGSVFKGPVIILMPILVLHIELDQLENEASLYFIQMATSEASLLFLARSGRHLTREMMGILWEYRWISRQHVAQEGGFSESHAKLIPTAYRAC